MFVHRKAWEKQDVNFISLKQILTRNTAVHTYKTKQSAWEQIHKKGENPASRWGLMTSAKDCLSLAKHLTEGRRKSSE